MNKWLVGQYITTSPVLLTAPHHQPADEMNASQAVPVYTPCHVIATHLQGLHDPSPHDCVGGHVMLQESPHGNTVHAITLTAILWVMMTGSVSRITLERREKKNSNLTYHSTVGTYPPSTISSIISSTASILSRTLRFSTARLREGEA